MRGLHGGGGPKKEKLEPECLGRLPPRRQTLILLLSHSGSLNEASASVWHRAQPDVEGRSQGVGVGAVLLPERVRSRFPLGWAAPRSGPGWSGGGVVSPTGPLLWPCWSAVVGFPSHPGCSQSPGTRKETQNETVSKETGALDQEPNGRRVVLSLGMCALCPLGTP